MKTYWLRFGSGDPRTYTGLAPTMIVFKKFDGTAATAPGITEPVVGSGLYNFSFDPTFSHVFICDGATTGLPSIYRYVTGNLDPADKVDELLAGIGSTASSYGTSANDPVDLFGYMKRVMEVLEGDAGFSKTTGAWSMYSRGSSTLLRSKTLSNAVSGVTKI